VPKTQEKVELNLSPKQGSVFADYRKQRWTIMAGSVRSGKTFAQQLCAIDFLYGEAIPSESVIISGKNGDSLERNIVKDFLKLANILGRGKDFEYKIQPRRIIFKPKKIDMWLIGANDEGSEERVRGMTAQAVIADECTAQNKACFFQQIARCSAGRRYKFCTTNPDAPSHWFKTTYIDDDELDVANYNFDIQKDNPVLDPEYVRELDRQYVGVDRERFLLGKWVADTEKLIIPEFQEHEHNIVKEMDLPEHFEYLGAMDLGMKDETCYVSAFYDFERAKKVIWDSVFLKHPNTKKIADTIREMEKKWYGSKEPYGRYSDTNLHVIGDLNELHNLPFSPTAKDDKDAQINALRVAIKNEEYEIHPRNKKLIKQLRIGTWNKSKKDYERTDEDGHFDGVDTCIYLNRNFSSITQINPIPFGVGVRSRSHYIADNFYSGGPKSDGKKLAEALFGV
jgi:PBSX family phage terminase large subunit